MKPARPPTPGAPAHSVPAGASSAASSATEATVTAPPPSRPGARLALYLVLAYAGAWLVCSPLWISGRGLRLPYAGLLLVAMMAVPTVAALVTARVFPDGRSFLTVTGLRPGPLRVWWRYALVAWWGPLALTVLALALAAVTGVYVTDLRHFSGYAQLLAARGPLPIPISTLVAVSAVQVVFGAFVSAVPALGEELGWRGFLRDTLAGRPRWVVVLVTGVVWGLWHAPIILLGYNYPDLPRLAGLGAMVVFTTLVSALLEWLRDSSGTVVVSALAHGTINSAGGLALLFSAGSVPVRNSTTGLLGWTGWVVLAVVIVALGVTRRLRLRSPVAAAQVVEATGETSDPATAPRPGPGRPSAVGR